MTGICDNYLRAFAIFLRASLPQMGMLSALPQLTGAVFQLLSVWLCSHFRRRTAIVAGFASYAAVQSSLSAIGIFCRWFIALPALHPAPVSCWTG